MATLVLAAALGGGGTSAVLPKVAPGWFRPDPATGAELRAVRGDLTELRRAFIEFLREGPREVRENQARMNEKLDTLLNEIRRRGEEHRQR